MKSKIFQYALLVICWIACIIGVVKGYYTTEIIPISGMLVIIGGMVANQK